MATCRQNPNCDVRISLYSVSRGNAEQIHINFYNGKEKLIKHDKNNKPCKVYFTEREGNIYFKPSDMGYTMTDNRLIVTPTERMKLWVGCYQLHFDAQKDLYYVSKSEKESVVNGSPRKGYASPNPLAYQRHITEPIVESIVEKPVEAHTSFRDDFNELIRKWTIIYANNAQYDDISKLMKLVERVNIEE